VCAGASAVLIAFHPYHYPRRHWRRRFARCASWLIGRYDFGHQLTVLRAQVAPVEQSPFVRVELNVELVIAVVPTIWAGIVRSPRRERRCTVLLP
jgi:hypothetical protein